MRASRLTRPGRRSAVWPKSLGLGEPDESLDPQVALYEILSDNEDLKWVRSRTARMRPG